MSLTVYESQTSPYNFLYHGLTTVLTRRGKGWTFTSRKDGKLYRAPSFRDAIKYVKAEIDSGATMFSTSHWTGNPLPAINTNDAMTVGVGVAGGLLVAGLIGWVAAKLTV